jgi:N-acetylglucosaminyldiphosphoundecaprenol N-acetyl-beta-D-mannosaminyltransferase
MQQQRGLLGAPVLCGVGAAFDFFIGRVDQAPRWMQKRGLEWLFRMIKEPVRIGKRYLLTLPHFVAAVAAQRLRGGQ